MAQGPENQGPQGQGPGARGQRAMGRVSVQTMTYSRVLVDLAVTKHDDDDNDYNDDGCCCYNDACRMKWLGSDQCPVSSDVD